MCSLRKNVFAIALILVVVCTAIGVTLGVLLAKDDSDSAIVVSDQQDEEKNQIGSEESQIPTFSPMTQKNSTPEQPKLDSQDDSTGNPTTFHSKEDSITKSPASLVSTMGSTQGMYLTPALAGGLTTLNPSDSLKPTTGIKDLRGQFTLNPTSPTQSPKERPTQIPTQGRLSTRMPTQTHTIKATEIPTQYPTFEGTIMASPFEITYFLDSTLSILDSHINKASEETLWYLEHYLKNQSSLYFLTNMRGVMASQIGSSTESQPKLRLQVSVQWDLDSEILPTSKDVDALIEAAFQPPWSQALVTMLKELLNDNPFSNTLSLIYTKSSNL